MSYRNWLRFVVGISAQAGVLYVSWHYGIVAGLVCLGVGAAGVVFGSMNSTDR